MSIDKKCGTFRFRESVEKMKKRNTDEPIELPPSLKFDAGKKATIASDAEEIDELELVRLYARCWNNFDVEPIVPYLADDLVYESQLVFNPLVGKTTVVDYLKEKWSTTKASGPEWRVFAEIGYCGSQYGRRVQVYSASPGRPCILATQGQKGVPQLLILLEVKNGIIRRIDLCAVAPHPSSATRTGEYPI